jgi:hypothetical protein
LASNALLAWAELCSRLQLGGCQTGYNQSTTWTLELSVERCGYENVGGATSDSTGPGDEARYFELGHAPSVPGCCEPSPVFDVMSSANSSPRREAASPPHPRRTSFRKRSYSRYLDVTATFLQLHYESSSLALNPAVTETVR